MLGLLRRYQKFIFVVVSVAVISSFVFYGAFSTYNGPKKRPDELALSSVTGRAIRQSELGQMVRFLASDRYDYEMKQRGGVPNYLNDGVIRQDILASGLYKEISKHFFSEIKDDIQHSLERGKAFRAYVHPQAPFISAENVYNQFMPEMGAHLEALRASQAESSPESFSLLVDLYHDQSHFPTYLLRQFLSYQEKQYGGIRHDVTIDRGDLALFHNHTLEEWFGHPFLELSAAVIINGADHAEKLGYKVSYAEARTDLMRSALEVMKSEGNHKEIDPKELGRFVANQLYALQMEERAAVELWRKVMLFRTLLSDPSQVTFVDPLLYGDFLSYANDIVQISHYHLPNEMRLSTLQELGEYELYLKALGVKEGTLAPPKAVQKVEGFPELVQNRYKIEVVSLKESSLALDVGVRQTWEWEVKDQNWGELKKLFPELQTVKAESVEERLCALDALDETLRDSIDTKARLLMVKSHPEWVEEALKSGVSVEKEIWVNFAGYSDLFKDRVKPQDFIALLESHIGKEAFDYSPAEGEHYRIKVLEKEAHEEILTFAEAKQKGFLRTKLNENLEAAYARLQKEDPSLFLDEKGTVKPLREVKNQALKVYLKDSLLKIEQELASCGQKVSGSPLSQSDYFYAENALYPYLHKARADILKRGELSSFLKMSDDRILSQWNICKDEIDVVRKSPERFLSEKAFEMKAGDWSTIIDDQAGALSFYRIEGKKSGDISLQSEMRAGQELISHEAKAYIFGELLSLMAEKEAYQISPLKDYGD